MRILHSTKDLAAYLSRTDRHPGCFADSGFLYALAYDDDRYFERANEVLEVLSEAHVSVYVKVVSRMEFVDLIFRKQVTQGCLQLFDLLAKDSPKTPLRRLLRNIRDQDSALTKQRKSFKIGERHLKELKIALNAYGGETDWPNFCSAYVGALPKNEWKILEEDFDLRFLELLEGQVTELFNQPVAWSEMVNVMATKGLRGPDAMIVNIFSCSKLPVLITTDSDIQSAFEFASADQAVFML